VTDEDLQMELDPIDADQKKNPGAREATPGFFCCEG
jgi:hypothetical protein